MEQRAAGAALLHLAGRLLLLAAREVELRNAEIARLEAALEEARRAGEGDARR